MWMQNKYKKNISKIVWSKHQPVLQLPVTYDNLALNYVVLTTEARLKNIKLLPVLAGLNCSNE